MDMYLINVPQSSFILVTICHPKTVTACNSLILAGLLEDVEHLDEVDLEGAVLLLPRRRNEV